MFLAVVSISSPLSTVVVAVLPVFVVVVAVDVVDVRCCRGAWWFCLPNIVETNTEKSKQKRTKTITLKKLSWRISCHQCGMYLKQTKKKNAPFCQRSRGRYTHVDVEVAVAGGGKVDIQTGGQESGTLFEERKVVQ